MIEQPQIYADDLLDGLQGEPVRGASSTEDFWMFFSFAMILLVFVLMNYVSYLYSMVVNPPEQIATVDISAVEGTPFYLSPESVTQDAYQDNRSDIYSLGCTLYHLIANEPPFCYDELLDVVDARTKEPAPDVRKVKPDVPGPVASVLLTMMAREPEDRYVTARECLEDLQRVIRNEAPLLIDPSRPKVNV